MNILGANLKFGRSRKVKFDWLLSLRQFSRSCAIIRQGWSTVPLFTLDEIARHTEGSTTMARCFAGANQGQILCFILIFTSLQWDTLGPLTNSGAIRYIISPWWNNTLPRDLLSHCGDLITCPGKTKYYRPMAQLGFPHVSIIPMRDQLRAALHIVQFWISWTRASKIL